MASTRVQRDPAPGDRSPGSSPIQVAVVNDYHLVVAGLAALLAPFSDRVEVVEIASNAPVQSNVDIVLFDTFAQGEGFAIPRTELMGSNPDARLVVFTWITDQAVIDQTREAGAAGMIAKSASAEELLDALERIHRGERVFPAGQSDPIQVGAGRRWPGDDHGLSARESEVLALICQGLSNQEIAERAYLGLNTVKTYIRTAYRKIGVTSRAQAVIWGLAHGFEPDHVSRRLPRQRS